MNIDRSLGRGSRFMRQKMQDSAWGSLFGISSELSGEERRTLIRRQVEAIRNSKDNSTPSLDGNFSKLYHDDATENIFYMYDGHIDETYPEPAEKRVPASKLLVGRMARANPPPVFTLAGLIWKKEG